MTSRANRPLGLLLAGGASALFALVLIFQGLYGRVDAPEGPWPPAKVAEAKLLPIPAAPAPGASETVERPLFVPTRRPPPPAPVTPPARIARDQFQLQGTIVVGGLDIAMLREKQSGRVIRVEKGASISDMTLAEVYPDRVVLQAGEETEVLNLTVAAGPTAPPPPPSQPGAPSPAAVPRGAMGQGVAATTNAIPPSPTPPGATPAPGQAPASAEEARRRAARTMITW